MGISKADILRHAQAPVAVDPTPVVELAREMYTLTTEIEEHEKQLKEKKAKLLLIERDTMPDLMKSLGITSQSLTNGWTLALRPLFEASIPSAGAIEKAGEDETTVLLKRRWAAFKWLRDNKAGDLIKNVLKFEIGKGEDAKAKKIVAFAKTLNLIGERTETVHAGTLKKYLREKLEAGADVPFDTFAVFSGEAAELSGPPQSKPKKKEKQIGN